jgi:hypothetical protein
MDLNHPVIARLNPPRGDALPAGFTRFQLSLTAGLPAPLAVTVPGVAGQLMLTLASGRVRHWLDLPADTEIAAGSHQREGFAVPPEGTSAFSAARGRTVPYLMLVIDRQLADAWPLITGTRQLLERGPAGGRQAVAEFLLSDFGINASAVATAAPAGCWIDLGIRPLAPSGEFRAPMLGRSRLQQEVLDRNPEALPFAYDFTSQVESGPLADGTPVGGVDWWLSHGRS